MPGDQLWTSRFTVPVGDVDKSQDILARLFPHPPPVALSAFQTNGGGPWRVEMLTETRPDGAVVAAALAAAGIRVEAVIQEPLADADWVALSRAAMVPVRAGRFFIHPRHHADDVPAGALGILIEAGLAFGSGSHGSTRGCLLALDALARGRTPPDRTPRRLLDVGCGSGILAIAMARAWPGPVLACDIDPVAVEVTKANAAVNRVGGRIGVIRADSVNHRAIASGAPYGLIVANILARPLCEMATGLSRVLAQPGSLVLSGLLASQEAQVRAAYIRHGLRLSRRFDVDGWRTLLFTR